MSEKALNNLQRMDLLEMRRLMNAAVTAGEIMLASGSETYRVEDTINRIGSLAGRGHVSSFVTSTGITSTLVTDGDMDPITLVRRIPERQNNLNRISRVNQVSRDLCAGRITIEDAAAELEKIRTENLYTPFLRAVSIVGTTTFFTPLMGGGAGETAAAFAIGILMALFLTATAKLHMHPFLENMLTTILIAFCAMQIGLEFHLMSNCIIIGCIMPLVPGAAITNAIRDIFHGDYMASCARILEAVSVAAAIAVGAAMGVTFS